MGSESACTHIVSGRLADSESDPLLALPHQLDHMVSGGPAQKLIFKKIKNRPNVAGLVLLTAFQLNDLAILKILP